MELRFERLIVLALNLEFSLELFDLKLEARNFGAELGEVGAGRALLWRRRGTLRKSWMLVWIREAAMSGLSRLRGEGMHRSRGIRLKSLRRRICEYGRGSKGIGQSTWPRAIVRRLCRAWCNRLRRVWLLSRRSDWLRRREEARQRSGSLRWCRRML